MDSKDKKISELKKRVLVQEETIKSWIDSMDQKKKVLADLQSKFDVVDQENRSSQKKVTAAQEKQEVAEKESKAFKD